MSGKKSFEEMLHGLEESVQRLEGGELSLEEALACYEQGVKYAGACRKQLQSIELKVQLLLRDRSGGLKAEDADLD